MLEESVERIVEKTGRSAEEARASLAATNPQGRFIQPDEVAAAVLWLCSDGGRVDHRPGDFHLGRRDMVSAPLSAPGISKDSKERLRLWIRLLRASRTIEAELRERLKKEFDTTLPRFDVMAALYRVAGRHADERPVALPAGLQRQRHRHRRPAGFGRPGRARQAQRRPPHLDGQADRGGHRRSSARWRRRTRAGSTSCSAASATTRRGGWRRC